MKHKLMTYDSMPWTREIKKRRHADIPGFIKKIGSGIKNWAKLRWIGISIENAAKTLNEAVRKSDKLLVKSQLGVLRGEFKKLEATYREVESDRS